MTSTMQAFHIACLPSRRSECYSFQTYLFLGYFGKKINSYTLPSKWKGKKQALLFLNDDRKMRQEGQEQIRLSNTSWNAGKEQETVWVSPFPKAKCVHPSICTAQKMSWATAILQEMGGGKMVLALAVKPRLQRFDEMQNKTHSWLSNEEGEIL